MRTFFLGFLTAIVLLIFGVFFYALRGIIDPRADLPVNTLERKIAMPTLDASVERHAPDVKNPLEPTDANLIAGMKIYQANCASCHGDIHRPHGIFADSLYPRAPQFMHQSPDMPDNQNFYIVQHGIRLSGMPAWEQILSAQQIWQVTTFLSHMDKLPTQVSEQWKTEASK